MGPVLAEGSLVQRIGTVRNGGIRQSEFELRGIHPSRHCGEQDKKGQDLPKDGPWPESLRGLTKATDRRTPRPARRQRELPLPSPERPPPPQPPAPTATSSPPHPRP